MPIRAGRFKSGDATGGITIVQPRPGAFYRILNGGENAFDVGDSNGVSFSLGLKFSLDVPAERGIVITTGGAVSIEGIYEHLNVERNVRSGRFKISNSTAKHKIIDLLGLTTVGVFYRIFNSGKRNFKVLRGNNLIRELTPEDSCDFEVAPAGNRNIWVEASNSGERIEGIYDFLGPT